MKRGTRPTPGGRRRATALLLSSTAPPPPPDPVVPGLVPGGPPPPPGVGVPVGVTPGVGLGSVTTPPGQRSVPATHGVGGRGAHRSTPATHGVGWATRLLPQSRTPRRHGPVGAGLAVGFAAGLAGAQFNSPRTHPDPAGVPVGAGQLRRPSRQLDPAWV